MLPEFLSESDGGCLLRLRVIPGARKTAIVGPQDGALKLKVAAPPVEGAANKELIAFLAKKVLRVSRSAVRIVSGERARLKVLQIQAPAAEVAAALSAAGEGAGQGGCPG